ncbi:hypothetical protein Aple_059110 [Acrocarpospora pleiomorpha]|uniref:Uncharacterized protein n=1 Tax=Acrocarpospora pleiomorpha TaxID=90975 RepID=A0A5M3XPT6_9ACTN|nr:hypothetical protein Aple_059110 [Acrocarpospora pleiomorpha]
MRQACYKSRVSLPSAKSQIEQLGKRLVQSDVPTEEDLSSLGTLNLLVIYDRSAGRLLREEFPQSE